MKRLHIAIGILVAIVAFGCSTSKNSAEYIDKDTATMLSGKWNDTDAKRVAEKMTSNIFSGGWMQNAPKNPVLIVGNINNNTMEHINTGLFISEIEKAIVNSPKVQMVADPEQRKQIRKERLDSHRYAKNPADLAQEMGADYMLVGNIDANVDKSMDGTKTIKFYKVTLELIDVEKNLQVWIQDKEIKKRISRSKIDW